MKDIAWFASDGAEMTDADWQVSFAKSVGMFLNGEELPPAITRGEPKVDDSFLLAPPFYTIGGPDISVGRNVFVNQNCTFYDLGGLYIADDVMIGPNVSIITSGHPIDPSQRRASVVAKPIVIERNVWIAAGATIIGGVTVGENSVVAAGSVVTKNVPPNTLVGGNPAKIIRSIGG